MGSPFGFGDFAIPKTPKAFSWLNFFPREFTLLYGLYRSLMRQSCKKAKYLFAKSGRKGILSQRV